MSLSSAKAGWEKLFPTDSLNDFSPKTYLWSKWWQTRFPERILEQSGSLSSWKKLWDFGTEDMQRWWEFTPRSIRLKFKDPLCLSFAPSNAHLAPALTLSEVMAEKTQWRPMRPRIIIQVCICIYVYVSKRIIDLMCAQSLCVCVFVHVKIMYRCVGGWLLDGLSCPCWVIRTTADLSLYTFLHPKKATWCEAISTLASYLGFPLQKSTGKYKPESLLKRQTLNASQRELDGKHSNEINGHLWG